MYYYILKIFLKYEIDIFLFLLWWCLPQQNPDVDLFVGAWDGVEGRDLGVVPEASLLGVLQVIVDHHLVTHLQLVEAQQGPGPRTNIVRAHLHHAVLRITAETEASDTRINLSVCR